MLSFIKNTSPLSFEGKNQKEFFSLYKETLKELNTTSALVVKAGDKYILKDYFLFYIDYCLSERKNMVIITKNEKDYNFLLDILKKKKPWFAQVTWQMVSCYIITLGQQ